MTSVVNKEIERKFLVTQVPFDLDQYKSKAIIQGYLGIEPDGREIRLRQKAETYLLAAKHGEGMVRDEYEIEITREQFDTLWPATEGRRIEKTRYYIPYGDKTIEFDKYDGALDGLLTAEVEFHSEEEGRQFTKPDWFGEDITEDNRYRNNALAVSGIPK